MGKLNMKALWLALGLLIVISPLGLLAQGGAWAEWGGDELAGIVGFVPAGLAHFGETWAAPLPDYALSGAEPNLGYIASGVLGVVAVVAVTWLLGRWLTRRGANG
ncbi:MAG: PDGLE domain-containing protein [Chloroflexota bacterium]